MQTKRKIWIIVTGICLLITVLAVIWSIPIHVYVQQIKNEDIEVSTLRALSTAMRYNPISNNFRVHYSDIYSRDTVTEYSRIKGVLFPRGSRLGPKRSDECRDEFYFTQVSTFDIHTAAYKKLNFQTLCGKNNCIKHESYPFCA